MRAGKSDTRDESGSEKTTFAIEVNNREVLVSQKKMTGREILTAASLSPELYKLFALEGEGRLKPIAPDDVVHVHPHERFTATRGDDGS